MLRNPIQKFGRIAPLFALFLAFLPARAATVMVAWNASTAANLAGYRVYSGTASGVYSSSLSTPTNLTTAAVSNLVAGQTYYFAVTATNSAGIQSAYSSEVSYTVPSTNSVPITNNAPVATAQSVTTLENTAKAILLSGTDADGNALTYAVVTGPAHGTLSGTAPNLTYLPSTNYYGSDSFTFKANDGITNSAPAVISISVSLVNHAPVATAQSVTTPANTAKAILLSGTDADGNTLTYAVVTGPAHGTLSGTAPNLTYQPSTSYYGSDSFTFKANDGITNSAPAVVSITVTAPNTAPVANAQSITTAENMATPITLTATDADGNALTYAVVTAPAHGTLSGAAPNLTYTPYTNYYGSDSFTFKANDGVADSQPATITLNTLPAPWQTKDIGQVGAPGGVSMAGDIFTVAGAGNLSGTADNFRILYQPLLGSGTITACINAAGNTGANARSGIMIRENLTSGSKYAFIGISPDGLIRVQSRTATSSTTSSTSAAGGVPKVWLRLTRNNNNTVTAYSSTDGVNWSAAGNTAIRMAKNIYIGVAAASGVAGTLNTVTLGTPTVTP